MKTFSQRTGFAMSGIVVRAYSVKIEFPFFDNGVNYRVTTMNHVLGTTPMEVMERVRNAVITKLGLPVKTITFDATGRRFAVNVHPFAAHTLVGEFHEARRKAATPCPPCVTPSQPA